MAEAAGRAPPPPWDTSRMTTVRCDVANVAAAGQQVMLHLGRREQRDDGTAGVHLLQALALTPYSARRVQELLAVLVREHDRRRGVPE